MPVFVKTPAQREAVKLLSGPALHTLLYGGSRSGKTFITVYKIICRALNFPGSRHCILRRHSVSVSKSIVADTFPAVMAKCFPQIPYTLNKSLFFCRFINGSEIWFGGLDASDKILGNEYATIYFNECSEMSFDQLETAYSRCAQKVKDCLTVRAGTFIQPGEGRERVGGQEDGLLMVAVGVERVKRQ